MTRALLSLLTIAAIAPGAALAQDEDRPRHGKIDEVERDARQAERSDDDDHWLIVEVAGDVARFLFSTPKHPGQGYQPYPWARGDQEPFVRRNVLDGRRYHTLSAAGFDDAASTLRGIILAFETVNDVGQLSFEYARYTEPLATETDRLHLLRFSIAAIPAVGRRTLLRIGLGGRALVLDDGTNAGGPELELGATVFPERPIALSVTLRGARLWWDPGSSFNLAETVTTASWFVGRLELTGGWRWTSIDGAPAFGGPQLGARLWF